MFEKHIAYKDEDFQVDVQAVNDVVHLHCYVSVWKPSVLKKMYHVFAYLKELFSISGYAYMATITPNPKFAKLFGGDVIDEKLINDKKHEVIVWELRH